MKKMSPSDFWKNFRLGEEVHISGTFIYNSLRQFHELEIFDNSDELFEFFYNLSIGIERLLKIAVVFYEHSDAVDQEQLEQSLITHNHVDLLARLRKHAVIKLGDSHVELLQILATFYKTFRYDRFSLKSAFERQREAATILTFLEKYLGIEITRNEAPFATHNEDKYRSFIRRTVLKIAQAIYGIIDERSSELGIYTYELRSGSKASSVFLREIDIEHEDILWKELLLFFIHANPSTKYLQFLRSIEPLAFDPALVPDYLNCFKSDSAKADVMDELEYLYEEMDSEARKERLEILRAVAAPGVFFLDDD